MCVFFAFLHVIMVSFIKPFFESENVRFLQGDFSHTGGKFSLLSSMQVTPRGDLPVINLGGWQTSGASSNFQ